MGMHGNICLLWEALSLFGLRDHFPWHTSLRDHCQLRSPSRAPSPSRAYLRGAGASLLSSPSSLPALKLSPRQEDGLLHAHHPLPYVPLHETSVSAELDINELERTHQLPN